MTTEDRDQGREERLRALMADLAARIGLHQFGDALALLRAHEDAVRAEAGEDIAYWQRRAEAAEAGKREAEERLLTNASLYVQQVQQQRDGFMREIEALEAEVAQLKADLDEAGSAFDAREEENERLQEIIATDLRRVEELEKLAVELYELAVYPPDTAYPDGRTRATTLRKAEAALAHGTEPSASARLAQLFDEHLSEFSPEEQERRGKAALAAQGTEPKPEPEPEEKP